MDRLTYILTNEKIDVYFNGTFLFSETGVRFPKDAIKVIKKRLSVIPELQPELQKEGVCYGKI